VALIATRSMKLGRSTNGQELDRKPAQSNTAAKTWPSARRPQRRKVPMKGIDWALKKETITPRSGVPARMSVGAVVLPKAICC